jgi:hypothetical protein
MRVWHSGSGKQEEKKNAGVDTRAPGGDTLAQGWFRVGLSAPRLKAVEAAAE